MGYTAEQLLTLNTVTKTSSVVGFVGVLAMFVMLYRNPESFKNPTGRLVLAITVTDLFDSVTKFIGRWGPDSGLTSFLCYAQTWSIQQFNISSVILGMLMGFNTVYLIFFKGSVEKIQKFEPYMILVSFIFPIPFALYPMFGKPLGIPMVGDVDTWCWISKQHAVYQIYLWFAILWIIFVLNLLILAATVWAIKKNEKALNQPVQQNSRMSFGVYIQRRMLAYLIGFVIVWTPSSLNRITQLALGYPVYTFGILQALVSPTRGFIDFLAYFYSWWYSPANIRDKKLSAGKSIDDQLDKKKGKGELQKSTQTLRKSPSIDPNDVLFSTETLNKVEKTRKFSEDIPLEGKRATSYGDYLSDPKVFSPETSDPKLFK
ncbi:hypothetical protein HDV01_007038 [Terramyces sp. JEL0728]|nr:hypothetical protein HDV01_007038 [Terramyces sp. JEL0728]